jgi:Mg-chelatase subunit ChlD
MRSPTAHQIEDRAALRQQVRVDLADLRNRTVVDMRDEPRDRVKYLIIVVIDASEEIRGKLLGHAENLF